LSAPFAGVPDADSAAANALAALPPGLWIALPALPLAAAAIGFLTAQGTVRRWLRRLP
jgi:cell division transport system permease protein